VCSGYRSITDIRLGHERNKPICIICPAGINSPLKVATNEVIHWMNVGVKGRKRGRGRKEEKAAQDRESDRKTGLARGCKDRPHIYRMLQN